MKQKCSFRNEISLAHEFKKINNLFGLILFDIDFNIVASKKTLVMFQDRLIDKISNILIRRSLYTKINMLEEMEWIKSNPELGDSL